jgi:hypothetical protein
LNELQVMLVDIADHADPGTNPEILPDAAICQDIVPFVILALEETQKNEYTIYGIELERHTRRVPSIVESNSAGLAPMYSVTVIMKE